MLNSATVSIGYLIFPVFMELLINSYGWKGAFLILSAFMGNICFCGLLLPKSKSQEPKVKNAPSSESTISMLEERAEIQTKTNACMIFLKEVTKAFDLSLFRNVRFLFQAIVNGILFGGCFVGPMYIVPYAVSVRVSATYSSFLMVAYGCTMVLVRLSPVGMIVDKKIVSASTLGGVIFLLYGVLIMITSLMRTYPQLMVVAILNGVFPGLGNPMVYVTAARSVGSKEKGPAAMSWFTLGNGVGASIIILLVGKYQSDVTFYLVLTTIPNCN